MKTRTILLGLMLLPLLCAAAVPARAQTAKPAVPSHQQTADAAARKQLAAYLADFQNNPEDATLRGEIVELARTLKPAPVIPQLARADFAKAAAQMKAASSADDFKAAATLFEQVAVQAPWFADADLNAASAYAKAADYDSAKRNLALYLAAVRPGVDTQNAEHLQRDLDRQQAAQQQQQETQQFQQALQQFRADPSDAARQQIIKLAQAMKTPPAIPEEAREHYVMAQAFKEKATESSGFASAIEQYKAALLAAPWWADAYEKLAIAQKAAHRYDDAIASLNLYLLTQPADARDAQDEIYKLKADKQAAAVEQARKQREEQQRAYESSPAGIAAREQREFDTFLAGLDGRRYTYPRGNGMGPVAIDVRGRFLITGQIDTRFANGEFHPGFEQWGPAPCAIQGFETTMPLPNPGYAQGIPYHTEAIFIISKDGNTITWRTRFSDGDTSEMVFRWQR
jgi:hypothetical protein